MSAFSLSGAFSIPKQFFQNPENARIPHFYALCASSASQGLLFPYLHFAYHGLKLSVDIHNLQ